eukprot:m.37243 g.37243  ORF g.37243 m.37243 type:complete len:55 (-) comp14544_c0_seq9:265-429(-)
MFSWQLLLFDERFGASTFVPFFVTVAIMQNMQLGVPRGMLVPVVVSVVTLSEWL